jgi:dsDNA-specific endonuclease/ATPase MutS2
MNDHSEQENAPIEVPIDGTLDLHQFPPQAVSELVPDYIALCHQRGIYRLRIIHGKGIGTLRTRVHARLKKESLVADFYLAQIDEGGWGATIVHLRSEKRPPAAQQNS